jgi:hypothetical protein
VVGSVMMRMRECVKSRMMIGWRGEKWGARKSFFNVGDESLRFWVG